MSVLDRLNNYSSRKSSVSSSVFDTSTPEGAFLESVHRRGFSMYTVTYELSDAYRLDDASYEALSDETRERYDASLVLSESAYAELNDLEKGKYLRQVKYSELHDVLTTAGNQVINAVAGSGKALVNGSRVKTPVGDVPIEELEVGDVVIGGDGKPCDVLGVYPQEDAQTVWNVMFSNGHEVSCNGEHLWTIVGKDDPVKTEDLKVGYQLPPVGVVEYEQPEDGVFLEQSDVESSCTVKSEDCVYVDPAIYALCYFGEGLEDWSPYLGRMHDVFSAAALMYEPDPECPMRYSREEVFEYYADFSEGMGYFGIPQCIMRGSVESRKLFLDTVFTLPEVVDNGDYLSLVVDEGEVPLVLIKDLSELATSLGRRFEFRAVDEIENLRTSINGWSDEYVALRKTLYDAIGLGASEYELRLYSEDEGGVSLTVLGVSPTDYTSEMTCIEVSSPDHLYMIEGCVVTHNTTALVLKILHDIVTGEAMTIKTLPTGAQVRVVNKMWVCTFLRTGASELETTLRNWQTKMGYSQTASQVTFSTMDAEFKRCLESMGAKVTIGDSNKLDGLLRKAIDSCNVKRDGGYNLTREDYQIIGGIVTYYRGRLDDKKYQHPSCEDYDITPKILDLIVKQFAALRRAEGIMDFEEVMELLYQFLYVTPNEAVQKAVSERYNYIYIDEFQDTSQMAYAILKFYARGKLWLNRSGEDVKVVSEGGTVPDGLYTGAETLGKFVAVGDPSQCLVAGTPVLMDSGETVPVEEIKVGDVVQCCLGKGVVGSSRVSYVSGMRARCEIATITTESGHSFKGSLDHLVFVKDDFCMTDGTAIMGYEVGQHGLKSDGSAYTLSYASLEEHVRQTGTKVQYAMFLDKERCIPLKDVAKGDCVLVRDKTGVHYEFVKEVNIHLGIVKPVYDIEVEGMHNLFAGGIAVHNCIYSFRGSDSEILTKMVDEDFRPTLSTLSVNWRCPSNILNPIVPSIHMNPDSASQAIIPAHEGGDFKAYKFLSHKSMMGKLEEDVKKDMDAGMSVAILCRTNFGGMIPAFTLETTGRYDFGISGDNMTLNGALPRRLIGVASLFTERTSTTVKNALSMLMPRNTEWQLKELMSTLKTNNKSVWDVPVVDLRYSCYGVVPFIEFVRPTLFGDDGKRSKAKDIAALCKAYQYLRIKVFDGDSSYCEGARACIDSLMYLIEDRKFKSVHEYLEEIEYMNDRLQGRIKKSKAPIQIATVHEFKGKERDSVYVWNDSEGVFPSNKCDISNQEQLAEERRVHYIACTRARKKERIYTVTGKVGMFVNEMDLALEVPPVKGVTV